MAWQVVIAGGGFGGFYAARTLERVLPQHSAHVTLVSDVNYMLYTPLLPGAAAGTLEPRHVVVPLREALHETDLRLGTVTGADPLRRVVFVDGAELRYDQLIVALGSRSRRPPVPGLAEHGLEFKTLSDAVRLRERVVAMLERAEASDDPAEREACLTFVFVGGGYAGLEGLAELQDFAVDVIDLYPRSRVHEMRWVLVEGQERVLPEIQPNLARFVERELRSRGIEVLTGVLLERIGSAEACLADGRVLPTRTIVWTAGVEPAPAVASLGLPIGADGRIVVDRYMRVREAPGVWAIGDAAAVPEPGLRRERVCPPTAQHSIRQGRRVARNVAAELGSGRAKPFRYRSLGVFVDMGRQKAVASTLGIRWRGFPAWLLARTYHLAMMPGVRRKLRLLIDWNVELLFGRDSSELGQIGRAARDAVEPESSDGGRARAYPLSR